MKQTAEKLNMSYATLSIKCSKHGLSVRDFKFNHSFFSSIDSEEKAYWLGFIFADGCVGEYSGYKSLLFHIGIKDKPHLELFNKAINSNVKIRTSNTGAHVKYYSEQMYDDLVSVGCVPRKSLILKYPQLSDDLNCHFIRGYFDGDGCVSKHNNGAKGGPRLAIIGTEQFIRDMEKQFISRLDIPFRKNLVRSGKAFKYDNGAYKQVRKICDWMYDGANIYLQRKRDKYEEAK